MAAESAQQGGRGRFFRRRVIRFRARPVPRPDKSFEMERIPMSPFAAVLDRFGLNFAGVYREAPARPRSEAPKKIFDPRTATAEELYEHYRFRMD
jgi:hypothetical protein